MKRILILMSDTGGGHRAAAEAIIEALHTRHPGQVQAEMVDVFRDHSPFPYKYMPEVYPWIIKHGKSSWGVSYELSNTRARARLMSDGLYVAMERGLRQMYAQHPADVVVCVHSLLTRPSLTALNRTGAQRPPFVTVVTDLVSTHMFWYDRRADLTLVPTDAAFQRGLEARLLPHHMQVTGLPVHPNFAARLTDKASARVQLGWHPDLPAVLVVGGGDGMGPMYKTARAIDKQGLNCQLVIIAGRNAALKEKLESESWNQPVHVYGYVTNMPLLMAAADVLLTKAGPATICEACIAGLPMILYDAIPGQETGNVEHVVRNHAGVYAPSPQKSAEMLRAWLTDGGEAELRQRAENARAIARPDAVWDIADEIWEQAGRGKVSTQRRRFAITKYTRYVRQQLEQMR
jgi:1,2-diacylglycerol 3-beta-galactosyltransferase